MSNSWSMSAATAPGPISEQDGTGLVLYYLADSRSQRVLWLLEELELHYELVTIEREPPNQGGGASLKYKKIHPVGRFPILVDKMADRVIAESRTIIDYILRKYNPQGRFASPDDEDGWLTNNYFTAFAEGSIMPWVRMLRMARNIPESPLVANFWTRPFVRHVMNLVRSAILRPQFEKAAQVIADQLETVENRTEHPSGWLAGGYHPTTADFMQSYPFAAVDKFYAEPPPSLMRYQERIRARPAWQRAIERAGAFGIDMG